ncbi:unnamed protein product, partial [Closterium sp. NIES-53]
HFSSPLSLPFPVLDYLITLAAPATPTLAAQAAAASYRRFTTSLASRSDLRPRAAPPAEPPAKPVAEPASQHVSAPKGAPPPPPVPAAVPPPPPLGGASFGSIGRAAPSPLRAAGGIGFDAELSEKVRTTTRLICTGVPYAC